MRRIILGLSLLLAAGCAHTAQQEARWNAAADKQEELARTLERLSQKEDVLEGRVEELKKSNEALAATVSDLKRPAAAAPWRPSSPEPSVLYKVPVGDGAVRGPAGAKVTIVEYGDFQCPFCARVADTLRELEQAYPKEIRFVFKHLPLPFHVYARPAAKAAEAAGQQGKFWPMFDLLFSRERDLNPEHLDDLANRLQLDMQKFATATADPKVAAKIGAQEEEAGRFGAVGTPSFFINGYYLSGAQPLATFKAAVERELARADKLLASGVKREELYDKLTADGKTTR
jgi:protein-disulfide isomerase